MSLLSTALLCSVLIPNGVYGAIPQQPTTFKTNWDEAGNPLMLWTFRQTECLGGTIKEDRGVGPDFVRHTDSDCPSHGAFTNAVVGATSTSTTARNTIKSGAVGTTFNSITTPTDTAPFRAMTIVLWFTPTGENLLNGNKYMLLEIGEETGDTSAFDVGDNQLQIYIQAFSGADNDRLFAEVLLNADASSSSPNLRSCLLGDIIEPVKTAAGVRHFLAVTLSYIGTNFVIGSHVGAAGGVLNTCIGAQGVSESFSSEEPKSFGFQLDSVIRVGSTRMASNGAFGFPATYHLVGIYDRALSTVDVNKLYVAGLPNSLPVVRNSDVVANENSQSNIINLNQSTIRFDYDGNPVKSFRIRSLPASSDGDLFYEGNVITSTDFPVTDVNKLTFRQAAAKVNNFSIVSGSTCTIPFASFNYVASDGLCDSPSTPPSAANCNSPVNATARICVVDVADPPQSKNILGNRVRAGSSLDFTLEVTDNDDFRKGLSDQNLSLSRMRELNGSFASEARVEFNRTSGEFGRLTLFNGTGCTTPLSPSTDIPFATLDGVRVFRYCYVTNVSAATESADEIGTDVFGFRFVDIGNTRGPWYVASFIVVNPLETCPLAPDIPISSLPGLSGSVCRSIGEESQANNVKTIPVYLQARDFVGNRTVSFRVTSLPSHGQLFLNANPAGTAQKGALVNLTTVIPAITGNKPNLLYQGNNDFFTRIDRPVGTARSNRPFSNHMDLGFDGCTSTATSCRCPISVDPGCPDTFTYKAVAGLGKSVDGVYEVHVTSKISNFTLTGPTNIAYAPDAYFNFVNEFKISIADADDDAYRVGVTLATSAGGFGLSVNDVISNVNEFKFTTASDNCINNALCSGAIRFYTTPSRVNELFSFLRFTHVAETRPGQTLTLTITVHKPEPDGLIPANEFNPVGGFINTLQISAVSSTTTAPAQSGGLEIAIIAGGSAVGFLVLVCCINACVWFIRKSRRAAKAARKSLASHRSKRQSQLVALEEDEERKSSRSESGMPCCGCLFGEGGNDRDEDDEHAAIARHRQSAASQRSHHSHYSTKSASNSPNRNSQLAVAMPPRPGPSHTPTPPMSRRDVEAAPDDSVFAWEKHIDRRTGDVYFFNPRTGVSQWDPPKINTKRTGK